MSDEGLTPEEAMAKMHEDELLDAIKLSPREFAQLVGMSPQLVYYHIRRGKLEKETCICGRPVVDVERSRAALGLTDTSLEDVPPEEEA